MDLPTPIRLWHMGAHQSGASKGRISAKFWSRHFHSSPFTTNSRRRRRCLSGLCQMSSFMTARRCILLSREELLKHPRPNWSSGSKPRRPLPCQPRSRPCAHRTIVSCRHSQTISEQDPPEEQHPLLRLLSALKTNSAHTLSTLLVLRQQRWRQNCSHHPLRSVSSTTCTSSLC